MGISVIRPEPRTIHMLGRPEGFSIDSLFTGYFKLSVPIPVALVANLPKRPYKKSVFLVVSIEF